MRKSGEYRRFRRRYKEHCAYLDTLVIPIIVRIDTETMLKNSRDAFVFYKLFNIPKWEGRAKQCASKTAQIDLSSTDDSQGCPV